MSNAAMQALTCSQEYEFKKMFLLDQLAPSLNATNDQSPKME